MSARVGDVYFDTCTLANFAVINRLDLLEQRYGYRARWTETVQWEIQRGVRSATYLQLILNASWLGDPVEVSGTPPALTEINNIRRGLGAPKHSTCSYAWPTSAGASESRQLTSKSVRLSSPR